MLPKGVVTVSKRQRDAANLIEKTTGFKVRAGPSPVGRKVLKKQHTRRSRYFNKREIQEDTQL
jgi:hypothetical protein